MDKSKRDKLVSSLSDQREPQYAAIRDFFDGNDDQGSIGCNLDPHPGMKVFASTLSGLLKRKDVKAVYAQISELEPGSDSWPFCDKVLVVGSISVADLAAILIPLQPDEFGVAGKTPYISQKHGGPVLFAWWD